MVKATAGENEGMNESVAAFEDIGSTVPGIPKMKTHAAEQPGAWVKFADTLIKQGVSVKSVSPQNAPGTTTANAWLPGGR
jgi:hypothetical protein